ncbi:MAG TPA: hypothetical protein VMY34_02000 [Acidimicrobiales bacterium]|nr:hypothetical protein [Acidimicrobiales bacterium]
MHQDPINIQPEGTTIMRIPMLAMPIELQVGEIKTRSAEAGDVLARHVVLPAGADFRPLLKGLPDDRCACPHWGYIIAGSIRLRFADGTEEVSTAGDVYYWPGGHTGWTDEGVTFLEFSPTAEILPVLEHLGAQLVGAG